MMDFRHKIKELGEKLAAMSRVAKHSSTEQVSHYRIGLSDGRADALMQAANLVLDLALEIQQAETEN